MYTHNARDNISKLDCSQETLVELKGIKRRLLRPDIELEKFGWTVKGLLYTIQIYIYIYVFMHICIYIERERDMCIYIYIHIYIHTYTYTHTYT